jgi:glycosyltransferase involved in cell wall biosynthesis
MAAWHKRLSLLPIFSVIIPTHNRPEYLGEAVNSVMAQSGIDFEILIVNDGDATIQPPLDQRIRVLENARRGAVPARNLGISYSRGDFIAFIDDDDVWTAPNHLTKAHSKLQTSVDFYFADGTMSFPSGDRKLFSRETNKHWPVTTPF